jgi:hypothetical protein
MYESRDPSNGSTHQMGRDHVAGLGVRSASSGCDVSRSADVHSDSLLYINA